MTPDPTRAHLVRSLLEAHGVEAVVQGELAFGLGAVGPAAEVSVWLLDEGQLPLALDILSRMEAEGRRPEPDLEPPDEPWTCPECGLRLGPGHEQCYRCGYQP